MKNTSISFWRKAGVTVAGAAALVALTSCGDDTEASASQTPEASQPTPAQDAAPAPSTAARDALLDDFLFGSGKRLIDDMCNPIFTRGIVSPESWDKVCAHKPLLENYYAEISAQNPGSLRVAQVAVRVAQVHAVLGSNETMARFEKSRADYDAMSEADKASPEGKAVLADIEKGLGLCLLAQNKPEEAFQHLKTNMDVRVELHNALATPERCATTPDEALAKAFCELISAHRYMVRCKVMMKDAKGAFEAIEACVAFLEPYKEMTPAMQLSLASLVRLQGELFYLADMKEDALKTWVMAVNIYSNLIEKLQPAASGSPVAAGYLLQAQRLGSELIAIAQALDAELKAAQGGQAPAEGAAPAEGGAPAEGDAPADGAPAEAPAPAPEAAPAPAPEAAPAPAPEAAAPAPAPAAQPASRNGSNRRRSR